MGVSIVAIGLVGVLLANTFLKESYENWKIQNIVSTNPEWQKQFDVVKEWQKKNKETNYAESALVSALAFEWKTLAEMTADKKIFQKSFEVYKLGADKFGQKQIPFFWNAGKVAEIIEDYLQAEFLYKEAIRVAPTYNESYHYLADLYEYKMKKTEREVLQAYADGITGTGGDASLFLDQCSYLRRHNRVKDAIECYDILVKSYPENQGYKEVLEELKQQ